MMSQEQTQHFESVNRAIAQLLQQQQQSTVQFMAVAGLVSEQLNKLSKTVEILAKYDLSVTLGLDTDSTLKRLGDLGRIGGVELAMEITGKARSTIYNLASAGRIPVARNGGRLQFSEAALRAYSFHSLQPTLDPSLFNAPAKPVTIKPFWV